MNTDILIKVYSQEEKVIYLFQYFEFYSKVIPEEDIDLLRYIIRQIDYSLLMDNVNLKYIQVYIKLLIERYYLDNIEIILQIKQALAEAIEKAIKDAIQEATKVAEKIDKIEHRRKEIKFYMDLIVYFISMMALKKNISFSKNSVQNTKTKNHVLDLYVF